MSRNRIVVSVLGLLLGCGGAGPARLPSEPAPSESAPSEPAPSGPSAALPAEPSPQTSEPAVIARRSPREAFTTWALSGLVPLADGWAVALVGEQAARRSLTVRRWTGSELGEVLFERDLEPGQSVLATTLAASANEAPTAAPALITLASEPAASRILAIPSAGVDLALPYQGPPYGRALGTRVTSAAVPTDLVAFYAQRVETLSPEQLEVAQAAACRGMRVPSLCGRVSPQRVVEDWVEVLTLTGGTAGARRLAVRTRAPFEEQTVAVDASAGGAVVAIFEQGRTDRFTVGLHWLDRDGAVLHHTSRALPDGWLPGTVAHRSDGAVMLVLPVLAAANRYGSLRSLVLDARGRQLARGTLPIEGGSFEGSFGALECGGALWVVTQQIVAARARVAVVASRVDARGGLATPFAVGEIPISEGTAARRLFFQGEPMRLGCRDGEAAVAFRDPIMLDPGTGDLAILTWRADER